MFHNCDYFINRFSNKLINEFEKGIILFSKNSRRQYQDITLYLKEILNINNSKARVILIIQELKTKYLRPKALFMNLIILKLDTYNKNI